MMVPDLNESSSVVMEAMGSLSKAGLAPPPEMKAMAKDDHKKKETRPTTHPHISRFATRHVVFDLISPFSFPTKPAIQIGKDRTNRAFVVACQLYCDN